MFKLEYSLTKRSISVYDGEDNFLEEFNIIILSGGRVFEIDEITLPIISIYMAKKYNIGCNNFFITCTLK